MEVILQTKIKMMIVIQVTINTHLYTLPLWQLFCAFCCCCCFFLFLFLFVLFFALLLNTRVRKGCLTFEGMCMELNKALFVTIGAIWSNLEIRYWLPFYSMTDLWREKRIITSPRGVEFLYNKRRKWSRRPISSWTQLKICLFKANFLLQPTYRDRKCYFTGKRVHNRAGGGGGGGWSA